MNIPYTHSHRMFRILTIVANTAFIGILTSSSRPHNFALADNSSSSTLEGIKVNNEQKEGSIAIHGEDGDGPQLKFSDAYLHHFNNDKKISPSLKAHSLSWDLSENCHEGLIHITMPDGSTKKMKNMITVPREALGGDSEISTAYWYGEDAADGSTLNYIRGVDGSIHGSVLDMTTGTITQLHVDSEGNPIAVGRLSEDFPEEEDVEAPLLPNFEEQHLFPVSDMRRKLSDNGDIIATNDSGTVLDIMVVWTEKAEENVGGIENMKSRINLAIQETNTAYALSGIDLELNLVHSYKSSEIDEPDSITIGSLESLKKNKDVKAQREAHGADAVVLLVTSSKSCGLAYVNFRPGQSKSSSKQHFYSVVKIECATGNFSFGHEIGHNLGARHDRGQETFCGDKNSYNYGYRHPGKFRSMMSYGCGNGKCDIDSTEKCNRVQRFSGQKVTFNGLVVGDKQNDNVRQINKVKAIAASFYSSKDGGEGDSSSPSKSQPFYLTLCIAFLLASHFML